MRPLLPPIADTLDLAGQLSGNSVTFEDIDQLEGRAAGTRPARRRALIRQRFTRDRLWLLGFGAQAMGNVKGVGQIQAAIFTAKPAVPFRPRRLVVQAVEMGSAEPFTGGTLAVISVKDVKIAGKSQFADASQYFPAQAFDAHADDMIVKFATANPGEEVAVLVELSYGVDKETMIYVAVGMFGYAAGRD